MLYAFGQISELILSNYWCQGVEIDTIHQHSIEYGLNHGTSEGCWRSKQFTVCHVTLRFHSLRKCLRKFCTLRF